MRYKSIITEEGTRIKAKENATSIANPITNNKIIIKPKATSYDKALSLARGLIKIVHVKFLKLRESP